MLRSLFCFCFFFLVDPFSLAPQKALETIGKNLSQQYERWQPRVRRYLTSNSWYKTISSSISIYLRRCEQARYKVQLDPTVDEVKKLCNTCRRYAKGERVLFHYNGHGVPKPTANGEIWLFNKVFPSIASNISQFCYCYYFLCIIFWTFPFTNWCNEFRVIHSIFPCRSVTLIPG